MLSFVSVYSYFWRRIFVNEVKFINKQSKLVSRGFEIKFKLKSSILLIFKIRFEGYISLEIMFDVLIQIEIIYVQNGIKYYYLS